MNMHAMNMWLTDAADGGCGGGLDFAPMASQLKLCGGITAGQVRHKSRNHNSNQPERTELPLMCTWAVVSACDG